MSTHANPEKAYVWLDGDAHRAPAGTALPTNPFATTVTSGTSPSVVTWDAFGGIEAGFEITPTQDTTPLPVWNRRSAPYKRVKKPLENRPKFRAVDYSKATVLTQLAGGSIVELTAPVSGVGGVYRWNPALDEEFALLFQLRDGDDHAGFYCSRVTLDAPAPRQFTGEVLDGFEFTILALDEMVPLTSFNPLAP